MPEVRIFQKVKDFGQPGHPEIYLEKVMETDFLPRAGDKVTVYGEVLHTVLRLWWQACGCVEIGMVPFWIDPPAPYDNRVSESYHQWWTDRDGDLVANLEAAGWSGRVHHDKH